jgi:hypothetical protein
MTPQAICRALEAGRWIGVIAGFGLALRYSPDPADQLHVLAPWLVGSVSGLTGIESVFLGRAAAQLTGYAPSAYQRQSGMSTLALAATALLAFALGWGSAADLAVVAVLLIFLVLSACNHLWSAWRQGNASLRSFTRPATTAALVAATLPIAIPAATTLGR